MSIITKQVKQLRERAELYTELEKRGFASVGDKEDKALLLDAADTIEDLSVKLRSAIMELLGQYYYGKWNPVSEEYYQKLFVRPAINHL